jgi:hypothetical protein
MKAGYMIVPPDSSGTAVGKIRKMRCQCTGDGTISASKLYEEDKDKSWAEKRVNYFILADGVTVLRCPECHIGIWYTS